MTAPNHRWRKFKNGFMQAFACVCAVVAVAPLLVLIYYLVGKGFSSLNWAFFTQVQSLPGEPGGGMANAIVGTFILLVLAPFVGVPIGVLGGVFLSEYGGSRFNWWVRFGADILNGVPSIVWGIVVYGLMVVPLTAPVRGTIQSVDASQRLVTARSSSGMTYVFKVDANTRLSLAANRQIESLRPGVKAVVWYHRESDGTAVAGSISPETVWGLTLAKLIQWRNSISGFSALAGGVVLGFMMIPLVMRTTEEVLQLVPSGYREAALALGISKWRTIAQIIMRTALKGIVTGALLALARVGGETAPLMFTAFGNPNWSHSLSEAIAAIPLQIFTFAMSPFDNWNRQAWAGALVLLFLVLCINIGVRVVTRDRLRKQT